MATNYSLTVKLGFEDTSYTRTMSFDSLSAAVIEPNALAQRILAINESLASDTAGGLESFILSDEGDNFASITSAYTIAEEITPITIPEEVN